MCCPTAGSTPPSRPRFSPGTSRGSTMTSAISRVGMPWASLVLIEGSPRTDRVKSMRSWSAQNVPGLPGKSVPLRLYDTSAGQVRTTEPGPTARMYVCGITPYDATHLGHANTYLAFDLVSRVWLDGGHQVHYTQNATDVDDPLLQRAAQT